MTAAALALALALLVAPRPSGDGWWRCSAPFAADAPVACLRLALAAAVAVVAAGRGHAGRGDRLGTLMLRRRRADRAPCPRAKSTTLQSALDVLVGELRVGAHPVAAFEVAASEVDGPVADRLRGVAARARLGADVAAGLRSFAASSRLPAHWERLALFWRLAQTHGLAIATLMRAAHRDIVERERFSARVDAGMAGARATAAVLAGLPVLGVCLGQLIGADPLRFLLSGGVGGWLLVVGVTAGLLRAACGRIASRDGRWHELVRGAAVGCRAADRRRSAAVPGPTRRPRGPSRSAVAVRVTPMPWPSRPRFDVLAACLTSGMAVSSAAAAAAPSAPRRLATVLAPRRRPAGAGRGPRCARGRIPTCRRRPRPRRFSGWPVGRRRRVRRWPRASPTWPTSPATTRRRAADARAQRASVLIAGPLGLCYLPAFVCLGIVPIVAGLAGDVLRSGLV